jgi:hypothetical protein
VDKGDGKKKGQCCGYVLLWIRGMKGRRVRWWIGSDVDKWGWKEEGTILWICIDVDMGDGRRKGQYCG